MPTDGPDLDGVRERWSKYGALTDGDLVNILRHSPYGDVSRLVAEILRLREELSGARVTAVLQANDTLHEDNHALRAKIERLRVAEGEAMLVVEQQARDIERLRADVAACHAAWVGADTERCDWRERTRQQGAEIARLTALVGDRHCCWWQPDGTARAICARCGEYLTQRWETP